MHHNTKKLKSVKGPYKTFDLNPKWEKLCRPLAIFHGIFIALPKKIKITKLDYAPQAHSRVSNIDFVIWILVGPYKYYMQNCQRTVKFYPIWGLSQRNCSGLQLTLVPGWDSAPHPLSTRVGKNFSVLWHFSRGYI
jgi:hypothetical protein